MPDHDPMCPQVRYPGYELECQCSLIVKVRTQERKEPRDEYHTMAELYEYRMLYNAAFANMLEIDYGSLVCKSWKHSDDELCFGGGWFIVMIALPDGQISNHYEAEHWDLFQVREVLRAPAWDGHTPAQAAERLRTFCREF